MTGLSASRREFLGALGGVAFSAADEGRWTQPHMVSARQVPPAAPSAGSLTDVAGVRVGHFTHPRRPTGCTAILFDKPPTAGADYAGSAAGESLGVMLQPMSPVDRIHGILLMGGGAMALGSTAGMVRFLEEQRVGHDWGVPNVRVPIVVGAVIDDLAIGDGRIPDRPGRGLSRLSTGDGRRGC